MSKEFPEEPSDDTATDLPLDLSGEELDFEAESLGDEEVDALTELAQLAKKGRQPAKSFSLKARRAIEDHLEQRRLRKEIDYFFDDEFVAEPDDKKT